MQGSFTNWMMRGQIEGYVPKVGDGATYLMYSDRRPFTIIGIKYSKAGKVMSVTVKEDRAIRTDKNGMSESQTYIFEPNPNGIEYTLTRRKTGRWIITGQKHGDFLLGHRDSYYDYSR